MRKILGLAAVILVLSGCSLTSTFTVGSDGSVSGTTQLAVPKSALRNVTTVEQWEKILTDNNINGPAETPQPDPSLTAEPSPSPSASCAAGEDTELAQWTYTCTASGDISLLGSATSVPGTGSLSFERNGTTLTIVQKPSSESGGSENPIGINGVSLFYATTTITFTGTVTSVDGGAQKVDDHTVSFSSDENQQDTLSATVDLSGLVSSPTSLALSAKATGGSPGGANIDLTASLATPADGQVAFFDGENLLNEQTIGADGTLVYSFFEQASGKHDYRAVFTPKDWWHLDKSEASKSISFKTLNISAMPKISGTGKVGSQLGASSVKSTPAATGISYQWLRNGKVISGQTGAKYKVVSADFKKDISVRITLRKTGYLSSFTESMPIRITKR